MIVCTHAPTTLQPQLFAQFVVNLFIWYPVILNQKYINILIFSNVTATLLAW